MKLRPSSIHHSQNFLDNFDQPVNHRSSSSIKNNNNASCSNLHNNYVNDHSSKQTKSFLPPKLQVFKKDGCYFALDNNRLNFYRRIEYEHETNLAQQQAKIFMAMKIQRRQEILDLRRVPNFFTVDVHIVPLKRIPKPILDMSICSADEEDDDENGGRGDDLSSNSDDGKVDFYDEDDDDDDDFDHDRFDNPIFSNHIDVSFYIESTVRPIFRVISDNRTDFVDQRSIDGRFSCEKCHKNSSRSIERYPIQGFLDASCHYSIKTDDQVIKPSLIDGEQRMLSNE